MANKMFEFAFKVAGKLDGSFVGAFKSADAQVNKTKESLAKLNNEQKTLEKMWDKGVVAGEHYYSAMKQIDSQIQAVTKHQERLNTAQSMQNKGMAGMKGYGGNIVKTMAVGTAMFGPPIVAAMKFESQMADVKKVVDFDTPEQYKQMSQDILNLSGRIPIAAEGLAQIVAAGGQSGIARQDLLAFAETAAKMGVAFDITADEAGQMMAQWRTAFKMNQSQVTVLADQINYLGNTTAASAPKISEVVTRIGPLGDVAGVASGDLAALGATIVGMGISEEVAATGIKNLMLTMGAGEAATKKQSAAYQELGLDAVEMAKRIQVDSKGAILDLLNTIKKLPKEQQASVLTQLVGRESIGAIAPLLSNTEALAENLNKVANASLYAGSMQKEFEARSATTEQQLVLSSNALTTLGVNIGSAFLPQITEALKTVALFTTGLSNWASENQGVVSTVGTLAAGAIGLSLAVNAVGFAYSALTYGAGTLIGSLVKMHGWMFVNTSATTGLTKAQWLSNAATGALTKAQLLWNTAMSMNPIALVIIGLVALGAAGYALYKNWEEVTTWIENKWKGLKELFSSPIIAKFNTQMDQMDNGTIPGLASGGIYNKGAFLTSFAEESGESAIPHEPTSRNIGLWRRTGEILGVSSNSGGISLSAPIQITIQGSADTSTIAQIQSAVNNSLKDLERRLSELQRQKERVSYV